MAGLIEITREEVRKYAAQGRGANSRLFFVADEPNLHYAVVAIDYPVRRYKGSLVMLARVVDDKVVVEADNTDKPLLDALIQQGIPREQIVLAYQGETIPEPTSFAGRIERVRKAMRQHETRMRDGNVHEIFVANETQHTYAVIALGDTVRQNHDRVVMLARVAKDTVIIEEDHSDQPLVDRLIQQGIPREQIVLAYQGETSPGEGLPQTPETVRG